MPTAEVGFRIGMYRDHETLEAKPYVNTLPDAIDEYERIIVLDPMLATGGSLGGCVQFLAQRHADDVTCICLLAAPEGIEKFRQLVDDLNISTTLVVAAVDERLNDHGYIVPGLGDAGDRLYGIVD